MMHGIHIARRDILKAALYGGTGLALGVTAWPAASAEAVNFADIGVGDPGGDWSRYTRASGGDSVNLVSIGNGPSAILNVLIAGGGTKTYDIINIVGGMQKPLVDNDLIEPIDTGRIPNWAKDSYVAEYLKPGTPGFEFIGYLGKIYGVPTVLQGDSFAFLPEATGQLDTYGALFDPKWKGFVALEDNYTTAGQKTALYLKESKQATIGDPANLTPGEVKAVVDFLIEKKREGQFRTLWSSFEQAVNLLVSKEVKVLDCWEPMVFVAKAKGTDAVYAAPREGYLLWAMAAYIVKNPTRPAARSKAVYDLLDFMLGGWYGARITELRGYMTNPLAPTYAREHPDEFPNDKAQRIAAIDAGVKKKFEKGGTWQQRWPINVETYEAEWARFKAAPGG
jgi:putative spermidine/putrescine transport system substrate-binding protein